MEIKETREQQYLRILTLEPSGKDDYEAVRYLTDKGYTDSKYQISKMRDSYNQVKAVVWLGPNSNGIDFINELTARAEHNKPEIIAYNERNKEASQNYSIPVTVVNKGSNVVGLAYAVIAAIIWFLKQNGILL